MPRKRSNKKVRRPKKNGLRIVYLPANNAHALLWHDAILLGPTKRSEVEREYDRLLKKDQ